MRFLATTPPGLEGIAADEIADLVGAHAERHHRGAVAFEAAPEAVPRLNYLARTLHRVLVVLAAGPIDGLGDVADLAGTAPVVEYIDPEQAFAVRASRHGEHGFTSVDVGDVTGQAVIDAYRDATGHRLPVDLDDPDVVLRAYVRHDRFTLGLDTTGERSLHRRWYRRREHDAPLRPTIAAALLRLAGWRPAESLVDPMCGSGTIPIEAALMARDVPPATGREAFAFRRLPAFDAGGLAALRRRHTPRAVEPDVAGSDVNERWIGYAREHARAAGVEDAVSFTVRDATEAALDVDVVVTNLPFGVRTRGRGLPELYTAFLENALAAAPRTLVVFTARPDLIDREPDERLAVRYGRLETVAMVFRA